MASINFDKLVGLVKKDGETTQAAAARALNVTTGQLSMLTFCQAQVAAGVHKKAPATAKSVKDLRDKSGNRWELIAARTGQSVSAVKKLYAEAGGDPNKSYTGRGRDFSGTARKPAARKPAARKPAARSGVKVTTSRRSSGAATARKPQGRTSKPVVRRRTKRTSGAANPS